MHEMQKIILISKASQENFCEMNWDLTPWWQLWGLSGCYMVYVVLAGKLSCNSHTHTSHNSRYRKNSVPF